MSFDDVLPFKTHWRRRTLVVEPFLWDNARARVPIALYQDICNRGNKLLFSTRQSLSNSTLQASYSN